MTPDDETQTTLPEVKTCSHCGVPKSIDLFRKLDNGRPGSWCRPCITNYSRERRSQRISEGKCPQCREPWLHPKRIYCDDCRRIGRLKKGYSE